MDKWIRINTMINGIVWGKYMILFLLLTGLWLMLRLKFLPFTHCRLIFNKTIGSLGKKKKEQGITSFQAVATALAGTLGVGSVVGVTTALTMGGPGALFWMCVSAILCIFASFGIGNVTPANTITETISMYSDLPAWVIGVVLAIFVAWIIFDKNNRIMRFNEITIPVISILYIGACCYLIFLHADKLGGVISLILKEAFQPIASIGGVSGFVVDRSIHYGISRGVFSNEAGMGSSPISHASVLHVDAIEQGFWGIF